MNNPDTTGAAPATPVQRTGTAVAGGQNPDYEPMLQFFEFEHLPARLAIVSKPFHDLAVALARDLPRNPERTVAFRKLLEAKDCAVRAALYR